MADAESDDVEVEKAQGWHVDPYGVHEQRWISQGRPSTLVRDGTVEGKDPPPDGPPPRPFVKVVADPRSMTSRDMFRADGDEDEVSPDLGSYGVTATDADVVFDSGLVGALVAEGALEGGRYGGSQTNGARHSRRGPGPKWSPIGFILLLVVGALLMAIGLNGKSPTHQVSGYVVSATSDGPGTNWVCDVRYSAPTRGTFIIHVPRSTVPGLADDCAAGQQVTVSYEQSDPANAHIVANGFASDFSGGSASSGNLLTTVGAIAFIGGIVWAVDWWRRRSHGKEAATTPPPRY